MAVAGVGQRRTWRRYKSKEQKEFEANVKAAGGEYYVVRSIDDVKEVGL